MFKCIIMYIIWYLLAFFELSFAFERQLNVTNNPNCNAVTCKNNSTISMVYVTATGPDDIIHYLWDYTGKPSILIAISPLDSELLVNCTEFCNGNENSIKFSSDTSYNFSLIINKIIEFNDVDDTGRFDEKNSSALNIFNTKHYQWKLKSLIEKPSQVELVISSEKYDDSEATRKGLVSLSFKAFGHHGHDDILPHLLHTPNSSQVELQLEDLEMDKRFNNSRFGVEVVLVSPQDNTESMQIVHNKNLDDEYAPGIFAMEELITSKSLDSRKGGFIQYRPISYTSKDRQIANSTDINQSRLINIIDAWKSIDDSIAKSFYPQDLNNTVVSGMNVSFGSSGDGFYKNRNYTTWTFSIGLGKPPQQKFSIIVIVVMCIALGIPFLLMIAGGIYFCCQHYSHNKRQLVLS